MNTALNDHNDSQILGRASCLQRQVSYGYSVPKESHTNLQSDHSAPMSQRSLQPTVEDALDEHWIAPTSCINSTNSSLLYLFPLNPRRRSLDQTTSDWEVSRPTKKQNRGMSVYSSSNRIVSIF
jgi:hypothetical protein